MSQVIRGHAYHIRIASRERPCAECVAESGGKVAFQETSGGAGSWAINQVKEALKHEAVIYVLQCEKNKIFMCMKRLFHGNYISFAFINIQRAL